MAADFTDEPERQVLIQTPIDGLFTVSVRGCGAPALLVMPLGASHDGLPDSAGPDERQEEMALGIGPQLVAGLKEQVFGGGGGFGNRPGILDGVSQRSLAIYVFASLQGGDHDILVLVRGGGNHDGGNVLVCQDRFVVVGLRRRRSDRCGAFHHRRVVVAHSRHLCLRQAREGVYDFTSPWAEPDDADFHFRANRLFGRRHRGLLVRLGKQLHSAQHAHDCGKGTAAQKIAPTEI